VSFSQDIVGSQVVNSGTCTDAGLFPITDHAACKAAAGQLGLDNSSILTETDAIQSPEGCSYYQDSMATMLVTGISDLSKGKGAYTVAGANGQASYQPVCSPSPVQTQQQTGACPPCAPKAPQKPDVVIPFFERDLCKLKITAKSIIVNDPDHHLGSVFLLWISMKPAADYQDQLLPILNELKANRQVHMLDFSEQVKYSRTNGWFAQQLLKLKIASMVSSEYYMVLDTKNTMIRRIQADTFFTSCNQGKLFAEYHWVDMPEPHKTWFTQSQAKLGVASMPPGYVPMSVTPIIMHTQTVKDMLQSIGEGTAAESICHGDLCQMLMAPAPGNENHATEFSMYLMYALAKAPTSCVHEVVTLDFAHRWAESLWRGVPGNRQLNIRNNIACTRKIAIGQWSPIFFGSQPRALQHMTPAERQACEANLVKIYSNAGLLTMSPDQLTACVVGDAEDQDPR